jgi:hypothetical protein
MPLSAADISPYEIVASIGVGGMGEVYRPSPIVEFRSSYYLEFLHRLQIWRYDNYVEHSENRPDLPPFSRRQP